MVVVVLFVVVVENFTFEWICTVKTTSCDCDIG